jgi:ribosomal protein L2
LCYLLEIANLNYGIKHGLKLGNMVQKPFSGESASLRNFSLGNLVCSINGTISRSAGNFSVILKKEHLKKMILKKKSGAISKFLLLLPQ